MCGEIGDSDIFVMLKEVFWFCLLTFKVHFGNVSLCEDDLIYLVWIILTFIYIDKQLRPNFSFESDPISLFEYHNRCWELLISWKICYFRQRSSNWGSNPTIRILCWNSVTQNVLKKPVSHNSTSKNFFHLALNLFFVSKSIKLIY